MGTVSVGFPRVWYFLIKSMTEATSRPFLPPPKRGLRTVPFEVSRGGWPEARFLSDVEARARQELEASRG